MDTDRDMNPESCIQKCLKEFQEYLDTLTIIKIVDDALQEKHLGEFVGADVKVRVPGSLDYRTPDALLKLEGNKYLCLEVKAGSGGDLEGIIEEIQEAARYSSATQMLDGGPTRRITCIGTLYVCREDYCRRVLDLISQKRQELMEVLRSSSLVFLKWSRVDSLIRISRAAGRCGHEGLNGLLQTGVLRETESLALVGHAHFLFTPTEPPPQYTATQLLACLIPSMPKAIAHFQGRGYDPLEREFTVDELYNWTRRYFPPARTGDVDQVRKSWIEKGLRKLVECRYATKDGRYLARLPKTSRKLERSICSRMCPRAIRKRKLPGDRHDTSQMTLADFLRSSDHDSPGQ